MKNLGLIIDPQLMYERHKDYVHQKITGTKLRISQSRHLMPQEATTTLMDSNVLPDMKYYTSIWKTYVKKTSANWIKT